MLQSHVNKLVMRHTDTHTQRSSLRWSWERAWEIFRDNLVEV
jgi:hypothetical protein